MKDNNIDKLMPVVDKKQNIEWRPFNGGLSAGYIARAAAVVPKVGNVSPWAGGGEI